MRKYRLRCTGCGATFPDDGVRLDCPNDHAAALLRTEYDERAFVVTNEASINRYGAWLPRGRDIATAAQTAVYRSEALGRRLARGRKLADEVSYDVGATLPEHDPEPP